MSDFSVFILTQDSHPIFSPCPIKKAGGKWAFVYVPRLAHHTVEHWWVVLFFFPQRSLKELLLQQHGYKHWRTVASWASDMGCAFGTEELSEGSLHAAMWSDNTCPVPMDGPSDLQLMDPQKCNSDTVVTVDRRIMSKLRKIRKKCG